MLKPLMIALMLMSISSISLAKNDEPESFHSFLRLFFTDAQYQLDHILFPIEMTVIEPSSQKLSTIDYESVTKFQKKNQWNLSLHKSFECESLCFNRVIYDNFKQAESESDERVYSLEDTINGVSVSWFFKRKNNKWFLVRYKNQFM